MATLLLIGLPASGKTTIHDMAVHSRIPDKYVTTQKDSKDKVIELPDDSLFQHNTIRDTTGCKCNFKSYNDISKMISKDTHIAFVFNIRDFYNDLRNPNSGTTISSTMTMLWRIWDTKIHDKNKTLYFIGTHADLMDEKGDVKSIIRNEMEKISNDYMRIAGQKRFIYDDYIKSDKHFHCINARVENEVKKVLNYIFNGKL